MQEFTADHPTHSAKGSQLLIGIGNAGIQGSPAYEHCRGFAAIQRTRHCRDSQLTSVRTLQRVLCCSAESALQGFTAYERTYTAECSQLFNGLGNAGIHI